MPISATFSALATRNYRRGNERVIGTRTARDRSRWLGVAALLVVTACGAADDQSSATTSTASTYCADVDELTGLLDGGATVEEYDELLTRIVDESPDGHAPTWSLMLVLSEEPFTYDNFNPAIDSLERLGPDLDATCADLQPMIVDDSGRIRSWPTG
jgi:hypothetical protein